LCPGLNDTDEQYAGENHKNGPQLSTHGYSSPKHL
jgi:hypothetical protein